MGPPIKMNIAEVTAEYKNNNIDKIQAHIWRDSPLCSVHFSATPDLNSIWL